MVNEAQARLLLHLARWSIQQAMPIRDNKRVESKPALSEGLFAEKKAVFITLKKNGALRGCIGSLRPVEALSQAVARHAVQAAFQDHRFPPVRTEELSEIELELSILTAPQPLAEVHGEALVQMLRPGIDGLIVEGAGGRRATFLPQVWRQLPNPPHFLSELCRKAGLSQDAWKYPGLSYQVYQVQSFHENSSAT